jgi:vacuolar-type H+-ATPase subunit I/STV1
MKDKISKSTILYKALEFLKQREMNMSNVKQSCDDIINAISSELKTINKVLSSLEDEDSDILRDLFSNAKFQKFVKGIIVMRKITQLMQETLLVA